MLLGVKNNIRSMAILAKVGRYPIGVRHKIRIIKYWCRLTRVEETKIIKQVYSLLRYLSELGFNTWVSHVKEILVQYNMGYFFENNFVSEREEVVLLNNLKEKLQD